MDRSHSTASDLNDLKEAPDVPGKKVYNVSKSRLISLVSWAQVVGVYLPVLWFIVVGVILLQLVAVMYDLRFDLQAFFLNEIAVFELRRPVAFDLGWKTMVLLALIIWYITRREKPVYLLDFSTFEPPESWKVSYDDLIEIMRRQECFTEESIDFMNRMLERSGCGPSTAWPPGILQCLQGKKADRSVEGARAESKTVICDCVKSVLTKLNIHPRDVDILVINCSLFSPTPSLCSMVINEFGMRSDILSYNLSGMGCSAGVLAVDLAKQLLLARPHSLALVVSTENLTQNLYHGNDRAFLLQNTLFRCGGAALVLSNRWIDAYRASFKLLVSVRTQLVNADSVNCVYETEDDQHHHGVRLSKDLVKVAGRAMEKNFTTLGPHVLPVSEQLTTLFWMAVRAVAKKLVKVGLFKSIKIDPYIPKFTRGIDHFCIHAGGRGVIDGIEKNLNLSPEHVAASRYALHTYGNTSSSSIWYEMDYVRKNCSLSRGQRVLQLAFGSGFKCNTCVWLCLNNTESRKAGKVKAE